MLITGASRGLGRAMAMAFGAAGATVWVGYRARERDAAATVESISAAGGRANAVQIDVRNDASVATAVDAVLAASAGIDVLVNNAGINDPAPFALMSSEQFHSVADTNLGGVYRCCRAVIRPMLARRSGAIVNVASISGIRANPGQVNYAASKAAVIALTQTLAAEVASHGIRVNAVLPGVFAAGMVARLDHALVEKLRAQVPAGRLGRAEECAAAVLFLASDAASYIVGQSISVDGGLSL